MKNLLFTTTFLVFYLFNPFNGYSQPPGFDDNLTDNLADLSSSFTDFNNVSAFMNLTFTLKSTPNSFEGSVLVDGNWTNLDIDVDIDNSSVLNFNRTYSSMGEFNRSLGTGWVHNYDMHLLSNAIGDIYFVDNIGRKILLTKERKENVYTPRHNDFPKLSQNDDSSYELVTEGGDQLQFNKIGKLIMLKDNNGEKVTLQYDNSGYLTQIKSDNGEILELKNDAEGKLTQVKDSNSGVTKYSYDTNGNLTQINSADGTSTTYTYDNKNNLTSIVDGEGNKHEFAYDKKNRMIQRVNPKGEVQTFSYPKYLGIFPSNIQVVENEKGEKWTYKTNKDWRITEIEYPDGSSKKQKWDKSGNLIEVTENSNETE
jgi:YD repeat-containing protein